MTAIVWKWVKNVNETVSFFLSLIGIIYIRLLSQTLISPIVNIANFPSSISLPSRIYLNLKMYNFTNLKCHLHNWIKPHYILSSFQVWRSLLQDTPAVVAEPGLYNEENAIKHSCSKEAFDAATNTHFKRKQTTEIQWHFLYPCNCNTEKSRSVIPTNPRCFVKGLTP